MKTLTITLLSMGFLLNFKSVVKFAPTIENVNSLCIAADTTKIDSSKKSLQIDDIKIGAKRPSGFDRHGTLPERQIDVKSFQSANTMLDAVKFYIPGIFYQGKKLLYENSPIRIAVNGRIVSQLELNSYSPSDIGSVRIISGTGNNLPVRSSRPLLIIKTKAYLESKEYSNLHIDTVKAE